VLVHGATGGVGVAAVQLAKAAGLEVFGTGGTAKGRELVLKQGAEKVFDHGTPDYMDQILAATGGRGVDIILDTMARDAAVLGLLLWNTPESNRFAIHSALATGFENGTLRPAMGKEIHLVDAPLAHKTVMQHEACGKIVLIP